MSVAPTSRRWFHFFSIPIFGLFSFIAAFFSSFAYLNFLFPDTQKYLPVETGDLSGSQAISQAVSFVSLSAGVTAALSGMFFWGLLMTLPWKWHQITPWGMTALFGSLISLLEIICILCLMWLVYTFLLLIIPPSSDIVSHLLIVMPFWSIGWGILTLINVGLTSKGLVFFGGMAAGMGFALLVRRIFSWRPITNPS